MLPRCRLCRFAILNVFTREYIAADGYIWHPVCFRWQSRSEVQ